VPRRCCKIKARGSAKKLQRQFTLKINLNFILRILGLLKRLWENVIPFREFLLTKIRFRSSQDYYIVHTHGPCTHRCQLGAQGKECIGADIRASGGTTQ